MIDIHAHILPGIDDEAKNWSQTLHMARLAVEDGITVMVAAPHLYKGRSVGSSQLNTREIILQHVAQLKDKLSEEKIPVKILPGCDFPLSFASLKFLDNGQVVTELSRLMGEKRAWPCSTTFHRKLAPVNLASKNSGPWRTFPFPLTADLYKILLRIGSSPKKLPNFPSRLDIMTENVSV
jgi:hypothetical protein